MTVFRRPGIYVENGGDNFVVKPTAKIGKIGGASFIIGAETTNAISVSIQLQQADKAANDIGFIGVVQAYLSDNADGTGVASTAPDTSVLAGTDGAILFNSADKVFTLQSEADGDIDIVITETGVDTWYLCVILPDGSLAISGAITFA